MIGLIRETDNDRVREIYEKANINIGTSRTQIDRVLSGDLANPFENCNKSDGRCMFLYKDYTITETMILGILTISKPENSEIHQLSNLAVDPSYQRQGIATELIKKAYGEKRPFELSTIGSNKAAIAFYNNCPWLELKEITKHHSTTDNIDYELYHYKSVEM